MSKIRSSKRQPKGLWSIDEIKAGFEAFFKEKGRYPTALEIDAYEYLPSSRSLQRSFGGLVNVRKQLFPEGIHNYTTGEFRSRVASQTFRRAQDYEEAFYDKLCEYFEPIAVHEHKVIRPGRVTSDFYIYHDDDSGVCLDLFYAKDLFSLRGVIRYKAQHYTKLSCPVVLVLIHDGTITQNNVDNIIATRQLPLPDHIKVFTEGSFWDIYIPALRQISKFSKPVA